MSKHHAPAARAAARVGPVLAKRLTASFRARALGALPSRYLVIVSLARLAIGGTALWASRHIEHPVLLHNILGWGGTMGLFFAVYGLIGHLETHLMQAIVRAVDVSALVLKQVRADDRWRFWHFRASR